MPRIHSPEVSRHRAHYRIRFRPRDGSGRLEFACNGSVAAEKELADAAACDAIRGMFDLMNICGEVVIGEGIKDDAPGIFKGEQLGTWMPGSPPFNIALDPIDGTTNISKGMPNSIACIAAASPEEGSRWRCAISLHST